MSQSSPRGGRRLFPADMLTPQRPVDPAHVRDVLANNLMHLADQAHAKVWVNDLAPDEALQDGNDGVLASVTVSEAEWRTVQVYGPFDLSVMQFAGARIPYQVRVELFATSDDVEWAAVLCLPDETTSYFAGAFEPPSDAVRFTSTGSTVPTWLAPTTSPGLIVPSRGLADRSRASSPTLDGVGGSVTEVVSSGVCVRVVARATDEDVTAELYGAFVAEFMVSA